MKPAAALIALPALVLLSACGQQDEPTARPTRSATPAVFQMSGSFTLGPGDFVWNPGVCGGAGGYDDLKVGAQAVVTDEAGTTLAVGSITESDPVVDPDQVDVTDGRRAIGCTLRLRVLNVPAGHRFYGVEVAHRGVVQFSEAEARKPIELEIG